MKASPQTFKIEIVRRTSRLKRKFSADHRYRQIPKQRPASHLALSTKLRETIAFEKQKTGCLNTIINKEFESRSFAQQCVNLLSKKKNNQKQEDAKRSSNFNSMLQNIKNVIKENERKEREYREAKNSSQPLYNNQFHCARSQIHQIYSNEERVDIFRMLRTSESRGANRKGTKQDKNQKTVVQEPSKPLQNPFFNVSKVVCFTMSLNDPNQSKKAALFQAPACRASFSACNNRRTISISKSSPTKNMAFSLSNDADGQYGRKLKNFFDFIFKVNFSNNIYVSLQLSKPDQTVNFSKYKVYICRGNNSLLVRSLMKRRFWWEITDNIDSPGISFYWTQNIVDRIQAKQLKTQKNQSVAQGRPSKYRKQLEDITDLNRKILPIDKAKRVENFILKQGFVIPFQQIFTADTITNHLPRNYCIGSKKNLFKSLFHYFTHVKRKDPFEYIPKTYHIRSTEDKQYIKFIKQNQSQPDKVWIVKPGQNSNRGQGIRLSTFSEINKLIKKVKHENGRQMTYIIQSYINRPFLYNNRKFDIRHFIMLTSVNGIVKAYWYKDGYVRTASELFDLEQIDNQFIHLTNDAIQKYSEDYQKYEPANKLSYNQFQRYLDYSFPSKNYNFERDIIPKIKQMATYIVKANYHIIDHKRHQNNFQIFGLDFMIDRDFKPWLIEVNYNPCLEVNCPVLERVIPSMLQNSFRLGLDPLFPPNSHFPTSKRFYLSDNYLKNLKYELIFDEDSLRVPIKNDYDFVDEKEKEEEYQDDGQELNELMV